MSAFATAAAGPFRADPLKRVNYTLGMVLGVDEFQQDQLYHAAGRRWHNRLLHGYGTVQGLAVQPPDPADSMPEIRVTAGVAVDPCGREICVPATMCVRLGSWLDRHEPTLEALFPGVENGSVTEVPLAVVLCYRECPDDIVPVPGEPCRTQEDAMQPSRTRDSFELHLAVRTDEAAAGPQPPNATGLRTFHVSHGEEAAVQAFGALLRSVRTVCTGETGQGRAELLDAVRALAPAGADDEGEGGASPPEPDEIELVHDEAADIIREAFAVWITEVRPRLRAQEQGSDACGSSDGDCCVLLAEIDLPVTDDWALRGEAFEARQERRPLLLHTRLLQELLAGAAAPCCGTTGSLATVEAVATGALRLWLHHDEPLGVPLPAITVLVDGVEADVVEVDDVPAVGDPLDNTFDVWLNPIPDDGATVELRLDLALIDVPGSPTESVADTLRCPAGPYIDRHGTELRAYTIFHDYSPLVEPFEDDLDGTHPNATVVALRGTPIVEDPDPQPNEVLTWIDGAWTPAPPPVGGDGGPLPPATDDLDGTYPALTVVGLQGAPVSDATPALNHYLRWNGSAWAPAHVGGFVIAPAGRYAIVGAGHFEQRVNDVEPIPPVYNDLSVEAFNVSTSDCDYMLRFGAYQRPEGQHMYVMNATAHFGASAVVTLTFAGFEDDGIVMRLRGSRFDLFARLMLEISRIG